MSRVDALIEALREADGDAADVLAQQLLREFNMGYPLARLGLLLREDNRTLLRAGIWIASELGSHAAPLLDEISVALEHRDRYVRFFAIDATLQAATGEHGEVIARAIDRIHDSDDAVRWKAMQLLARASDVQLESSTPYVRGPQLKSLMSWLVSDVQPTDIVIRLADLDPSIRRFAAAAAVRIVDRDSTALRHASMCTDEEINSFANEELELWNLRRQRGERPGR